MDELHPCSDCNRHFRIGDADCPFCAAPRGPVAERKRTKVGRFTRAVVFSGALIGTAAVSACGDDNPPLDAAPSVDGSATVNAGTPDAAPGTPDAAPDPADASTEPDAFVPLPYGAPPARARLV